MKLLIFNPEHDYALADGNPHFVAMRSAAQFSHDCAPFLQYLFNNEDIAISLYKKYENGFEKNYNFGCDFQNIDSIIPWGWNAALNFQLSKAEIPQNLLPDKDKILKIRELSHRKISSSALKYIRENFGKPEKFPQPAEQLFSIEDIKEFVNKHPHSLFKAPYSGNGRGHLHAHGKCTPTFLRQCQGVISRQGSILAEMHRTVIQDFAMEFFIISGNVKFEGYSLFQNNNYGYGFNKLLSDNKIEETICKFAAKSEIETIKGLLIDFLTINVAPDYEGCAGVDMFFYKDGEEIKLNPLCEINLRNTMGYAAHKIFKKFCDEKATGKFGTLYFKNSKELKQFVENQLNTNPLKVENGKWVHGFKTLSPIFDDTHYAIYVNLQ